MNVKRFLAERKSAIGVYAVCLAIFLILMALVPNFGTIENILNVIKQSAYIAIPAVGLTMVMIQGGIDLSVGGMISVAGVINGVLIMRGVPVFAGFLLTIAACALLGLVNGLVIARIKVPPFIATYTVGEIAGGIALVIGNGRSIGPFKNALYSFIGNGRLLGIPIPDLIILLVALAGMLLLSHTAFGNRVYAVGNNPTVVQQEGLSVERIKIYTYILCAICSAISGLLLSARMSSASPVQGDGYQLKCVAACIIGGVSMNGGSGKVFNSVLGAFFIAALSNALNMMAVDPFLQNLALGTIIIIVVAVSLEFTRRASERQRAY